MSNKQIQNILLLLLLFAIIADILIRWFYNSNAALSFNSQEFNNIASPVISFIGFIGVIITILLTLNQLKQQQATNYFNYYREYIDEIANWSPKENSGAFSTIELLQFPFYSGEKYEILKSNPEYMTDLQKFKTNLSVTNDGKSYDSILGNIRLFKASLIILLRKYYSLINEIQNHKVLDKTHKEILFKDLYETQLGDYTSGCWLISIDSDLIKMKENLYIAFSQSMKDKVMFYDSDFYELLELVEKNETLNLLKNAKYK